MHKHTNELLCRGIFLLLILSAVAVLTGTAAAGGVISVDTTGLLGEVGSTIQVPVTVTGATDLSGYQMVLNTGTGSDAVIKFNRTSASGKRYDDGTGRIIWTGNMKTPRQSISGDATLFSLDVTPTSGRDVAISLTLEEAFERCDPAVQVYTYSGQGGVLQIAASYTINATVDGNGSITPSGDIIVKRGVSKTFTASPEIGHYISDIIVDGISKGASANPYTFENVQDDHTIKAVFVPWTGTITATAGNNGTINPSGSIPVAYGESKTFTITPDDGCVISDLTVDGVSQPIASSYTFENIDADHTISANFTKVTYTIDTDATGNGRITPSQTSAEFGADITFTTEADAGYHVNASSITVTTDAGTPVQVTDNAFTMPADNVTISAAFDGNVTVTLFNNGTGVESFDNVFGETAKLPTNPVKEGYIFAGWNVSLGGGNWEPLNSDTYIKDGNWNYTGTDSSLDIYANWSVITYEVKTSAEHGTITPSAASAEFGADITFTTEADAGYHVNESSIAVTTDAGTPVTVFGNAFTMPADNVTISAAFDGNVTITNFHNGTGVESFNNIFGDVAKLPTNPVKEGYVFAGWNISLGGGNWEPLNSDTYIKDGNWNYTGTSSSLDIYANWSVITYEVKTSAEHGTITPSQTSAEFGADITFTTEADAGYHVNASSITVTTDAGTPVPVTENAFTMPADNVTISAAFDGNVTITNFHNGTGVESFNNVFGDVVKHPADPIKEGYIFAGWNVSLGAGNWDLLNSETYIKDGNWNYTGTSSSLDIYANWSVITYEVKTSAEHGTITPSQTSAEFDAEITFTTAADTGYHVNESSIAVTTDEGTPVPVIGNAFTMPADNVTISAVFDGNVTITNFHNETNVETLANIFGETVLLPEEPVKEGYAFTGWNVSLSGDSWDPLNSETYIKDGCWNYTEINGTVLNIHANWTIRQFTITFDSKGGSEVNPITLDYNTPVTAPPNPERTGYTFLAWNPAVPEVMPAEDITCTAQWEANIYNITCLPAENGEISASETAACDAKVTVTVSPASGYQFSKLIVVRNGTDEKVTTSGNTFTMPAYDVNVTAEFTKKSSGGGGGGKSQGGSVILPAAAPSTQGAQITRDTSAQYSAITFIGASTADIAALKASSPVYAASLEIKLSTAAAAGIRLTNSKGAPAIVFSEQNVPDINKVTFSRVYEISPANPNEKLTQVTVTVPKADVIASGLTTDDVTIYHYLIDYDIWIPLDTLQITEDTANYYYTAATDGTSPFGVLIKRFETKVSSNPVETPASPVPLVGLLTGLGAAAVLFGMRRK